MNARERFNAVMHYEPRDRCPIMDFGFWDETLPLWTEQGMPAGINPDDFFGMDPQWKTAQFNVQMQPDFVPCVLEDHGESRLVRDADGAVKEELKSGNSIPKFIGHTLRDRESWEKEFKWRFNGPMQERFPENWDELLKGYLDPNRDYPLACNGGSLFGRIRDWMGLEGVAMIVYDDFKLFEEMVETVTDTLIATVKVPLEAGVKFDYVSGWEDMCYRSGPLLSPKMFKKVLVPNYIRFTNLLKSYGCDTFVWDCDGDIAQLAGLWLEAGINCMFPLEVGVWNQNAVDYRKKYGKEMRFVGNVNKVILSKTYDDITREVERLAPLVEEGGVIPTPDHRVPPDVSYKNYIHYIREARRVWGKNAPSLRPMDPRAEAVVL